MQLGSVTSLGRALFLQAAIFNNSCIPNCIRRINGTRIEVITTGDVAEGQELTICYTDLFLPTFSRQAFFSETKMFTCECERCRLKNLNSTLMMNILYNFLEIHMREGHTSTV